MKSLRIRITSLVGGVRDRLRVRRIDQQLARQIAGPRAPGGEALHPTDRPAAIIVPPAAIGSLGDDALARSTTARLESLGYAPSVALWRAADRHEPDMTTGPTVDDLLHPERGPEILRRHARLVVLGADVVDGSYGTAQPAAMTGLIRAADHLGLRTDLVSFSVADEIPADVRRRLAALPAATNIATRDPISHANFERQVRSPIGSASDVASLLEPASGTRLDLGAGGRAVVGLTVSSHWRQVAGDEQERRVVAALRRFAEERDIGLLVGLPHDQRTNRVHPVDDWTATEQVMAEVSAGSTIRVVGPDRSSNSTDLKYLAGCCDLVVTSRMHVAVGSLSQGVPTVLLTYSAKARGLQTLVPALVLVDEVGSVDELVRSFSTTIDRRTDFASSAPVLRDLALNALPEGA